MIRGIMKRVNREAGRQAELFSRIDKVDFTFRVVIQHRVEYSFGGLLVWWFDGLLL